MPKNKGPKKYLVVGAEAEYVDGEQTVLDNKLGITRLRVLHQREEEGLVGCYQTMLRQVSLDTPLSNALIRQIHREIFGDIFEWAGTWRVNWISKGETIWPNPAFLDDLMQTFEAEVLQHHPPEKQFSDDEFCSIVALIQGEFLTIHPFREGNARTIKVLTDLFAAQTDRPLLKYDETEEGQQEYINAAIAAFGCDYAPMERIIQEALNAARN